VKRQEKGLLFCEKFSVFVWIFGLAASCCATAQSSLPNAPQPQPEVSVRDLPANILRDQGPIWTSPAKFRVKDLDWFVPLAAATGVAMATDHDAMIHVVSRNPSLNSTSTNASNALTGTIIATPVALFGWGELKKNERARETGILGAEAMVDGVVVEQGIKLIFWRERPAADNSNGKFFQSAAGIDSSFPSSHAVVSWSAAAVLAGEYPSRMSRLLIYSAATGVSLTRVVGQQHFPSDVIVGSAAGWLIGHYVFRKHHRAELDDQQY
jgi:membrane-associated phospholipid phosphatase